MVPGFCVRGLLSTRRAAPLRFWAYRPLRWSTLTRRCPRRRHAPLHHLLKLEELLLKLS